LSEAIICARGPFPEWQYVHGCDPDHTALRYVFAPPTGFALLWHQTVLHVPADHVTDVFTLSVPAVPTAPAYVPGVTAEPVYGFVQRFVPEYTRVLYVCSEPLSENTTSAYWPEPAALSPLTCTAFPRVERFAWHASHAVRYVALSVCAWWGVVYQKPFPGPLSSWQTVQPATVRALSHFGSVDGVPWHEVPEHVMAAQSYVPPTEALKDTFRVPFTWREKLRIVLSGFTDVSWHL
jgi:hypothetical protein